MLTYMKTMFLKSSDFEGRLMRTLRAGHWDDNPFQLPPSGKYSIYKQGDHVVLVRKGADPHSYHETFWYCWKSITRARSDMREGESRS